MAGPKKLKIGNHVYTVEYAVPLPDGDGEYLYGRTHSLTTRIQINDRTALSQQRDTMLHEILHALFSDTPAQIDDDTEERVIRAITPGLLGVLRNNPALLSYLTSKETDG